MHRPHLECCSLCALCMWKVGCLCHSDLKGMFSLLFSSLLCSLRVALWVSHGHLSVCAVHTFGHMLCKTLGCVAVVFSMCLCAVCTTSGVCGCDEGCECCVFVFVFVFLRLWA